MMRKFVLFVFFGALTLLTYGQEAGTTKEKRSGRPDIPGTFSIDFGLNFPMGDSAAFETAAFGSRTLNVYYQLDKRIGQTKFSVHPGLGFGFERYKFNNNRTLGYVAGPNGPFDELQMIEITSAYPNISGIKKSQLITNYLDAIVEFRFSTNPNDPARSFKVSAGFKAGILIDSFTKLKLNEDGETKKFKNKQDFNLNPFRYGATLRIGAGNFGVFGYYSLSPIFRDKEGPNQAELTNFTVGLTLAGF
ncbi:MAG: outer membrane beta-barrel protein [Cyclobacteriaceae bacterium]|nr:MAG: outer membrane beta-barrel protein [Cyclobacteriaceae bacterium]